MFCDTLAKRTTVLGAEDHPDTLQTMHDLGMLYGGIGKQEDALKLVEITVRKRAKILEEGHPDAQRSKMVLNTLTRTTAAK
jgi:Tetratricopeptide repeat